MPWEAQLTAALAELVQEHLDENRWTTIGDIEVYLARDDELHTGVFGVASRMESNAPPRRRPQDSLSLPVMPGVAPGDYPQRARRGRPGGHARRPAVDPGAGAPVQQPPNPRRRRTPRRSNRRARRARRSWSTPPTSASSCATAAT